MKRSEQGVEEEIEILRAVYGQWSRAALHDEHQQYDVTDEPQHGYRNADDGENAADACLLGQAAIVFAAGDAASD